MSTLVELSGWGNYPRVPCSFRSPDGLEATEHFVRDSEALIPRGLGRSYGDQALSSQGLVLGCEKLDHYISFDEERGILECEAGVSLAQIIEDFAPRGWFPKVTPGTKFVTLGGCIANDVHGKGHHQDGSFIESVESFQMLMANGELQSFSRESAPEIFLATFGGLGLLGFILKVRLRLERVETSYFCHEALVAPSLEALMDALDDNHERYRFSVAWIDPLATGSKLGRGVLSLGSRAKRRDLGPRESACPLRVPPTTPKLTLPWHLPDFALNALSLRALNRVIERVQSKNSPLVHYEAFFYPLDRIAHWNRGYGRRGFTQYQFVVPLEDSRKHVHGIVAAIARSGMLPFLNVLKRFGQGIGGLSFPIPGYTLAIDFPIQKGLGEFLQTLDQLVLNAGGRVYLGKDAFLEAQSLRAMYPDLPRWMALKTRMDPENRFRSALADRLDLLPNRESPAS